MARRTKRRASAAKRSQASDVVEGPRSERRSRTSSRAARGGRPRAAARARGPTGSRASRRAVEVSAVAQGRAGDGGCAEESVSQLSVFRNRVNEKDLEISREKAPAAFVRPVVGVALPRRDRGSPYRDGRRRRERRARVEPRRAKISGRVLLPPRARRPRPGPGPGEGAGGARGESTARACTTLGTAPTAVGTPVTLE